jgi:hypothetical protein
MSRDAEREEMLPEYDFSDGVRGRYATRFGPNREEFLQGAAALDRQAWLAHSLLSVQELESKLVAYWVLALGKKHEEVGRTVSTLLEALDRRPFATLRRDLGKHTSVTEGFFEDLVRLIEDRNWLVHRSFHSLSRSRLEAIADRSARLSKQLASLLHERCVGKGMDADQVETQANQAVERWAAGRSVA